MKNIRIIISQFFVFLALSSCTNGFEEINENPNLISEISPGTLLNEIIYGTVTTGLYNNPYINNQLMQVNVNYPSAYGGVHRYEILQDTGSNLWNNTYKWSNNLREMLLVSEKAQNGNYTAVALTLRAWIFSNLTDTFGSVPMSEASRAEEGITQPKFDTQEQIYMKILQDLERANTLYNSGQAMVLGDDILFHNNVSKWQKFTNALRLRTLLKVSKAYPQANSQITEMLSDATRFPMIESDSDDVSFNITGVSPNLSVWTRPLDYLNATGNAMSSNFIDMLKGMNDPRLSVIAIQATNASGNIGYFGVPSGFNPTEFQINYTPSVANQNQIVAPFAIPIITYSEIQFIKSELAFKNIINGDAKNYYEEGVKAAIKHWTGSNPTNNYFDNPEVAYDGTFERIMKQKYLALYFTDIQQWVEKRRTGYPTLPTTNAMLNSGKLPSRLYYPLSAIQYNQNNYNAAVQQMGGDDINIKSWWE